MKLNRTMLSHLFLLVGAVNVFLGAAAVINKLGLRYYFISIPTVVRLEFTSPFGDLCLLIGSLYLLTVLVKFFEGKTSLPWVDRPIYLALSGSLLSVLSRTPLLLSVAPSLASPLDLVGTASMFLGGVLALCVSVLRGEDLLRLSAAEAAGLLLIFLFSLLIPIGFWASLFWSGSTLGLFFARDWPGADLQLHISNLAYPIAPWLFVAFLFSWVWMPLLTLLVKKFRLSKAASSNPLLKFREFFHRLTSHVAQDVKGDEAAASRLGSKLLLVFSLIVGSFLAYSPYLDKPEDWLLGDDAQYYCDVLTRMEVEGVFPAFKTNKPLHFLLLYLVKTLTLQPPLVVVRLLSVITVFVFLLSVFWLVKTGTGDELLASLSSLFSAFSFTTIIGLTTGLYANWFALSLSFLFFTLLLKALRGQSKIYTLSACLVSVSILLVHYSVWAVSMAVTVLYLVYAFVAKGVRINREVVVLGSIMLLNAIIGFACLSYQPYIAKRLVTISESLFSNLFRVHTVQEFWTGLRVLVNLSTLSNSLMLFLSVIGMVSITGRRDRFSLLMLLWTAVSSVGSVLMAPFTMPPLSESELWRFIFIVPFQIPAAIGLHSILCSAEKLFNSPRRSDAHSKRPLLLKRAGLTAIFLIVNYIVVALLLHFGCEVWVVLFLLNGSVALAIVLFSKITKRGFFYVFRALAIVLTFLFFLNYALSFLVVFVS